MLAVWNSWTCVCVSPPGDDNSVPRRGVCVHILVAVLTHMWDAPCISICWDEGILAY